MTDLATDLATLRDDSATAATKARARERPAAVLTAAEERRHKLVRQLEMADEFIGLLAREVG